MPSRLTIVARAFKVILLTEMFKNDLGLSDKGRMFKNDLGLSDKGRAPFKVILLTEMFKNDLGLSDKGRAPFAPL